MTRQFILLVLVATGATAAVAAQPNGFDLDGALVPADEILSGGPPRDGIPAIDEPRFETAAVAGWLADDARVMGVERAGLAKAYPIAILNWHEIVNDDFAGEAVLVTYCPLCGSGVVFAPGQGDFGVSGLLYNSDVLLYDRATESLWSQLLGKAVTGPRRGERLQALPAHHTTWAAWRARWPDSLVLSRATGFERDYDRDPYAGYDRIERLFFPVAADVPDDLHPKARVFGLALDGAAKAWPLAELATHAQARFTDRVGEREVVIHWDAAGQAAWATDPATGGEVAGVDAFWFAWYAFHPGTAVFAAP